MARPKINTLIKACLLGTIIMTFFPLASHAQKENEIDDEVSKWLNSPILVEKRSRRTSTWIRKGKSNVFIAEVKDRSLKMTVSASGDEIVIEMKDPKNKYSGGKYTGKIENGHFSGSYQIQFVQRRPEETTIYSIRPGANLSGADLSGADLSRADLTGANLEGADLTDAVVSRASTKGVDFKDWARRGGIVED